MKKCVSILLSIISVICISLYFVGCSTAVQVFIIGTYEVNEIEDEPFSKAKLVIQAITEEEFENANGINVIKNSSTSKENKTHYSFNLYLYDDNHGNYVQAEISNVEYCLGTPGTYLCKVEYEWENETIQRDISFIYSGVNGSYFYYNLTESGQNKEIKWLFQHI